MNFKNELEKNELENNVLKARNLADENSSEEEETGKLNRTLIVGPSFASKTFL